MACATPLLGCAAEQLHADGHVPCIHFKRLHSHTESHRVFSTFDCNALPYKGILRSTWHVPLTRVHIHAGSKAHRLGRRSISSNNGHFVPLKAYCLICQGAGIDYAESVRFAGCDRDDLMAAARVARRCPGLLSRLACMVGHMQLPGAKAAVVSCCPAVEQV